MSPKKTITYITCWWFQSWPISNPVTKQNMAREYFLSMRQQTNLFCFRGVPLQTSDATQTSRSKWRSFGPYEREPRSITEKGLHSQLSHTSASKLWRLSLPPILLCKVERIPLTGSKLTPWVNVPEYFYFFFRRLGLIHHRILYRSY